MLLPQEKKRRREENLKRRLENERKAEVVQVVSPLCQLGTALGIPHNLQPPVDQPLVCSSSSPCLHLWRILGGLGEFPGKLGTLEVCPLCSPKLGNTELRDNGVVKQGKYLTDGDPRGKIMAFPLGRDLGGRGGCGGDLPHLWVRMGFVLG